jgi:hypothetical protein
MATVFEHTYASYEFNAVVLIQVNVLRSAYTLACLRKFCRQPLSWTSLLLSMHVMINNHKSLSDATTLWRQSPLHLGLLPRIMSSGCRIRSYLCKCSKTVHILLHLCNSDPNLFHCPTIPTNANMSYNITVQFSESCYNPCLQKNTV